MNRSASEFRPNFPFWWLRITFIQVTKMTENYLCSSSTSMFDVSHLLWYAWMWSCVQLINLLFMPIFKVEITLLFPHGCLWWRLPLRCGAVFLVLNNRIRIPYNFEEHITQLKSFLSIETFGKCHILKMWHVIEATKTNFPSKNFRLYFCEDASYS
jgi:hypothetical protein